MTSMTTNLEVITDTTRDISSPAENTISLSTLQDSTVFPSLWYKMHVFLFDLRHYRNHDDSATRLACVVDTSYIGLPYFTTREADTIKHMVVSYKTGEQLAQVVQQTLSHRFNLRRKRQLDSKDFSVCTAHDLAPVFENAWQIDPKQLAKDTEFLHLLKTHGLDLGESIQWDGPGRGKKARK
jgi:hypothetical protein